MKSISFITKNNNKIYSFEMLKTLLYFIEYDFSYFKEQCRELLKDAKKSHYISEKKTHALISIISKSHPFIEASINEIYNNIVTDCIIDDICLTEGRTIEDLWLRYISPKNAFEKALFSRLSEYRTNKAVNQWQGIVKAQEYAIAKVAFIFNGEACSVPEANARCKYFDLANTVASKEMGISSSESSFVKKYSVSNMPNSVFILNKPAKDIYKRIEHMLDYSGAEDTAAECNAFKAFDSLKGLARPDEKEMFSFIESLKNLPDDIYLPGSFKALIDFEIEKMLENGLMLLQCKKCNRYFKKDENYSERYCYRVKSTGKSCREEFELENFKNSEENIIAEKCEKVSQKLIKIIDKDISKSEFQEWSEYLNKLKSNIQAGNSTHDDLKGFLEHTEKMYGIFPE